MEQSWLVQRLRKPIGGRDNPFAFGGGLKNGGLSEEAMGLLRGIFSFDYMGSAEFEFGAVPRALDHIAKSNLESAVLYVELKSVPKNWRDKSKKDPEGFVPIYLLAPSAIIADVTARVLEWTRVEYPRLKEAMMLCGSLRSAENDDWQRSYVGWFELDNGFMFFTDREMWEKTCQLFGVDTAKSVSPTSEKVQP